MILFQVHFLERQNIPLICQPSEVGGVYWIHTHLCVWLTLTFNFISDLKTDFPANWLTFTLVSKSNINVQFVHQGKYKDCLWLTPSLSGQNLFCSLKLETHIFTGWGHSPVFEGVGHSPPVYLLFGAVYWSRQLRVFQRLMSLFFSRECILIKVLVATSEFPHVDSLVCTGLFVQASICHPGHVMGGDTDGLGWTMCSPQGVNSAWMGQWERLNSST